jgi:hypothetical protein
MANENPTHCRESGDSPAIEDAAVEGAILAFVFDQHPTHLTIPELSLAVCQGREEFGGTDEIEGAIRELVGAGLLRIACGLVLPTRAALYFDCLGVD